MSTHDNPMPPAVTRRIAADQRTAQSRAQTRERVRTEFRVWKPECRRLISSVAVSEPVRINGDRLGVEAVTVGDIA